MAQGGNGHVTINVGLANGIGNGKKPSLQGLGEDERNRRARRLRKEGWSYRRIAATLGMSYAAVSHLLDGDEARVPYVEPMPISPMARATVVTVAPLVPANEATPAQASASARIDELAAQVRTLQQRLDAVIAMNETHRQNLARLERTMVTTLQNEHRALAQRVTATVKSLLERMLPTGFRIRPSASEEDPHE